jgi:pyridoxamine-phosphate oxidase
MDVEITSPTPSQVRVLAHNQYFTAEHITPSNLDSSPLTQFHHWFTAASSANVREPEAMTLSTVDPATMTPSSRVVLFKELDQTGFVFYTNYTSRKSRELEGCGKASLCFYWREVHRQVRVVGRVEKVDKATSEAYFKSRPLGSRLGAWASKQSTIVGEGEVEKRLEDVKAKFGENDDVPLPEFWGGWRVVPDEVEFWCGKPSRLHDRVRYLRRANEKTGWKVERLSP